jgi:chromosomal replication initiator protein
VHEFAGKEKTQDSFFHIFNHLHQSGKQLILTCDRPPVELQGMEQRLLSRFKWGLQADLQKPDYETRLAVLKKKAYNDGIELPDEIFDFLAANITNNIRELEAALISLYAQSTLNKKEITLALAKLMVDKLISATKREITIDYIQKTVCDYYKIPVDLMQGKTRKREIVQARQVSMFFSKGLTKASLANIGSHIGGKDHATVLHACKAVNNLIDTDKHFRNQITELEKKLKV